MSRKENKKVKELFNLIAKELFEELKNNIFDNSNIKILENFINSYNKQQLWNNFNRFKIDEDINFFKNSKKKIPIQNKYKKLCIHDKEQKDLIRRELKLNMLSNTSVEQRTKILNEIYKYKKTNDISIDEAKEIIYKKHNIVIKQKVPYLNNLTTEYDRNVPLEYNEFKGCNIFGWTIDGECSYESREGLIKDPFYYGFSTGLEWRTLLKKRYEKLKNDNDICLPLLEKFNGQY